MASSPLGAAVVGANFYFKREKGKEVAVEALKKRDIEAIVSASGKIQAKRFVNISADTVGRITELVVEEGDNVKRGQFLLQIDPRNLESNFRRGQAGLAATQAQLETLRTGIDTAKANLQLSQDNLRRQRDLWAEQLTTKEALDRSETEARLREKELVNAQQQITTQQARIREQQAVLSSAQYDLTKVRVESPIDGIVTRRNVEQGEMVMIGTMNNAGTVLLVIADMSIIEAEVEVDETDVPFVKMGQEAKITIDAMPDQEFKGKVTEIGNSPIQATTASAGTTATNFKVVVQLEGQIPDVRPGFTCTAEITTATRQQAVSVPIQAMVVREMVVDDKDSIVRQPRGDKRKRGARPPFRRRNCRPGRSGRNSRACSWSRTGPRSSCP